MLEILIIIAVFTVATLGSLGANLMLKEYCPMFKAENARLSFSLAVLCLFAWPAILLAFAVVYGVEAGMARAALKKQDPPRLRSGAELELYS